jgi:2-iminobutanoate/2-iminopropanoate deaminase
MPKKIFEVANGPKPVGPYSPGVRVGDFVYVSGQGGVDPTVDKLVTQDVKAQTKKALENVQTILGAAGLTLDDVFKVSVFLRNASDFQSMNAVYKNFFPASPPARTTIVTDLLFPEMLIEIEAAAYSKKD